MRNGIAGICGTDIMATLTATLIFSLAPKSPLIERAWQKIIQDGSINERIKSLILIEPGFGLSLESVQNVKIGGVEL